MRIERGTVAWATVAVFAAAILSHAASLDYGFFADDFEQVRDAWAGFQSPVLLGSETPDHAFLRMTPATIGFFRPVLHLSFWLDARLFDAHPAGFHATSILLHAMVAALLFLSLQRILAGRGALVAFASALVFAVHPGSSGAVNWIAARGDVLQALFGLAALHGLLAFRQNGSRPALAFTFLALALGVLAKESALVLPVALAVLDVLVLMPRAVQRSTIARILPPIALLAQVAGMVVLRESVFGDRASLYGAAVRTTSTSDLLTRFSADAWPMLRVFVAGYFEYPDDHALLRVAEFAVLAGVVLALKSVFSNRSWRAATCWCGLFVLVMTPALRFLHDTFDVERSRLLYVPSLVLAPFIAAPLLGFRTARLPMRIVMLILFAAHVALMITGAGRVHAAYRGAAAIVESVRERVEEEARHVPPDTVIVVEDLPLQADGAPVFFNFLSFAFVEPFRSPRLLVRGFGTLEYYLARGEHETLDRPLLFLRRDELTGNIESRYGLLPAPEHEPRSFTLDTQTGSVHFDHVVPPRGFRAIELELSSPATTPFSVGVVARDLSGRVLERSCAVDPAFGSTRHARINVRNAADWVTMAGIAKLEVRTTGESAPAVIGGRFLPDLPTIELGEPTNGTVISIGGDEPRFTFVPRDDCDFYRFRLLIPREFACTLPRRALEEVADGKLAFRLSMSGMAKGDSVAIPWNSAYAKSVAQVLDGLGVASLPLLWEVSGLAGQADHAAAQSATGSVLLSK